MQVLTWQLYKIPIDFIQGIPDGVKLSFNN